MNENKKYEKFDRSQTHANIGTIGKVYYGKGTLTEFVYKINGIESIRCKNKFEKERNE